MISPAIKLTIEGVPVISKQPGSVNIKTGEMASFSVDAQGTDLSYQWQWSYDGVKWNNSSSTSAKTKNYIFKAGASDDNLFVRCLVKNSNATIVSETAKLTLIKPAKITSQPQSQSVKLGDEAIFSISATGTNLTYQWQWSYDGKIWKNSGNASGTKPNYSFKTSAGDNNLMVRCIVKSSDSTLTSDVAKLSVVSIPKITKQPQNQTVKKSDYASFAVEATGINLTYQWQWSYDGKTWRNSGSASGTKPNYSFITSAGDNNLLVKCIVKNSYGSVTSETVKLTVASAPSITKQPLAKTVKVGEEAVFTISATGTNLTYQWQWSYDGKTWRNSGSASGTKPNYSFKTSAGDNNLLVRCIVKDSYGTTTSSVVKLIVNK